MRTLDARHLDQLDRSTRRRFRKDSDSQAFEPRGERRSGLSTSAEKRFRPVAVLRADVEISVLGCSRIRPEFGSRYGMSEIATVRQVLPIRRNSHLIVSARTRESALHPWTAADSTTRPEESQWRNSGLRADCRLKVCPMISQPASPTTSVSPSSEFRHPGKGARVAIVGAGVIGAASAHYLAEAGCSVVLLDRGNFGKACSHGNCGYVSPSHILPLCKPGAVSASLRTLFQRNSPFKIRPRLDYHTWSWFLKFALRCNYKDMIQAGHARHAMLMSSRQLFQDMMTAGKLGNCEWETKGLLFVHHDPHHFELFAKINELLVNEYGLGAKRYDADELLKLEPALKPVVAGAWLYECDAHLRPHLLMDSFHQLLIQQGVEIRENCEFLDLETSSNQAKRLKTSQGDIEVDHVIFATGAWSRLLQQKLKTRIPIEPGKGYSITMPRPALCPAYPMIFEDHRVAITPTAGAYRIGSTMEFAGFDSTLREDRLSLLTNGAKFYLQDPLAEPVIEKWWGWRPMSCDGVPLVGRVPKYDNVWLAAGHSMLGLSMATATGKLLMEMLTGATPHIDPRPYRLDRF